MAGSRQLSTSISDAVLALSSLWAVHQLFTDKHLHAAAGLLVFCIASSIGVLRFALIAPPPSCVRVPHETAAWLASALGLPSLAVAYLVRFGHVNSSWRLAIMCYHVITFLMIIGSAFIISVRRVTAELQQTAASIAILIVCVYNNSIFGMFGIIILSLSGLVIGTTGRILEFKRVDVFHYGLSCAVILLALGISTDTNEFIL